LILLAVAALSLPATSVAQSRMYRWVDDKGVVHYGDTIPPQFANRDRDVLNQQAISVGFEEGEVTPEERAEIERLETEAEAAARAKAEIARRDRMLLQTYLSVADIEDLRDRRLELLESQIKVTELYLSNLRKRFTGLQQEASRFKPYSTDDAARQIPENLALDLSRTEASISLYEQTLARTRNDQQNLKAAFDEDIVRFKELKGG
jgi:hypothetical protein